MRTLRVAIACLVSALAAPGLAAQDVASRLAGRVSPEVQLAVQDVAKDATARGLPVEPLIQKAIEGGAKGVPAGRIIAAVRTLAGRLGEAKELLRAQGEAAPSGDLVEGGADALGAGLSARQVRELVQASHPPYDPALTLRVAATLAALGVPQQQTVGLLERMIKAGREPGDLVNLPGEVLEGVARGETASQAAEGLGLGHGGGNAGGNPGQDGNPGNSGGNRPPVPPGQTNPHRRQPNPHKP